MPGFGEALFELSVGGIDVTERFNPILEHVDVQDRSGETTSKAQVLLSDVDGQILLPAIGENLVLRLGWTEVVQVFEGVIDDVRSRGGRSEGRQLTISAHGFDTGGKAKEPLEFHKDKASLQDFMSEAAGKAGLSFQAEGRIASIMRDYWAAGTESFIHLGQRIAHETGAVFKIQGGQAFMWPLNSPMVGVGSGGDGSIGARWGRGGNLISWDIAPIIARPRFAQARTRYYDHKTATWKETKTEIAGENGAAEYTHRQTRADEDEANGTSGANSSTSQREAGSGNVSIVGEPGAFPEGTCNVAGVRPGVDGAYRIDGVNHRLSRGSGFLTHLELKQPGGGAGSDSRIAPVIPDHSAGAGYVDSVVDDSAVGP